MEGNENVAVPVQVATQLHLWNLIQPTTPGRADYQCGGCSLRVGNYHPAELSQMDAVPCVAYGAELPGVRAAAGEAPRPERLRIWPQLREAAEELRDRISVSAFMRGVRLWGAARRAIVAWEAFDALPDPDKPQSEGDEALAGLVSLELEAAMRGLDAAARGVRS